MQPSCPVVHVNALHIICMYYMYRCCLRHPRDGLDEVEPHKWPVCLTAWAGRCLQLRRALFGGADKALWLAAWTLAALYVEGTIRNALARYNVHGVYKHH